MNLIELLKEKIDAHHSELWQKDVVLKRGAYLKMGGTTDSNIYFVKSGSLRLYMEDEDEELTIRFGYTGSIIAALDSFITEQKSELFIQAIRKSELKVMDKGTFMQFIFKDSENLILWLKIVEQLVYQQLEREQDILTSSPRKRLQRVLKRSPHLFQEVPLKYIASYLRMTPETLSRLQKS